MWIRSLSIEFAPLAAFFVFNYAIGFFAGVAAMLIGVVLSTALSVFQERRVSYFVFFTLAFILVFGGGSLYLQNPDVFIIQDTVKNALLGFVLLGGLFFAKTPLLKVFFENSFAISDRGWRTLTMRWAVLFLALAIGNEIVRMMYDEQVWVLYRAGTTAAIVLFGLYQFTLSKRERIPEESNWLGLRTKAKHMKA